MSGLQRAEQQTQGQRGNKKSLLKSQGSGTKTEFLKILQQSVVDSLFTKLNNDKDSLLLLI